MGHVKRNYFIFLYFWGEKYNENQLKVPIFAVYRKSSLVGHLSLLLNAVEQGFIQGVCQTQSFLIKSFLYKTLKFRSDGDFRKFS